MAKATKSAKKPAKAKKNHTGPTEFSMEPAGKVVPIRQSEYTDDIGAAICARIVEGEALRSICKDEDMPGLSTVFKWLAAHPSFVDLYARAREEQADTLADEIVGIADEQALTTKMDGEDVTVAFDATAVARNRLRVDARKWVAAKLKPRKYGDKLQHGNDPDNPMPAPQFIVQPVIPASVAADE